MIIFISYGMGIAIYVYMFNSNHTVGGQHADRGANDSPFVSLDSRGAETMQKLSDILHADISEYLFMLSIIAVLFGLLSIFSFIAANCFASETNRTNHLTHNITLANGYKLVVLDSEYTVNCHPISFMWFSKSKPNTEFTVIEYTNVFGYRFYRIGQETRIIEGA